MPIQGYTVLLICMTFADPIGSIQITLFKVTLRPPSGPPALNDSGIVNCFLITISPLRWPWWFYLIYHSLPYLCSKIPSKRPQTCCKPRTEASEWVSELPASDELTAGRSADGLDVVVLQLHSLRCQLVQCRCVDVSVVVADVVEALIICHDEDNVRTRMARLFDLVRTRPVLGQIAQTEQTHHRERCQSRCCHGNAFKRLLARRKIKDYRLNCRYERKVCVTRQSDVCEGLAGFKKIVSCLD